MVSTYANAQFKYNKVDFYLAGSYTNTQYQREGLFQHEAYENNSFGKGDKVKFNGIGAKALTEHYNEYYDLPTMVTLHLEDANGILPETIAGSYPFLFGDSS